MIAAGIALLPDRFPKSLETIESLLPQVDAILLSLNGFESIPKALLQKKIEVRYMGSNLGDIGKFHKWQGEYLSCDDDLIYPDSYVEDFRKNSKQYPDTVLTHHGNSVTAPVENWFRAKEKDTRSIHCLMANNTIQELTIPGTGVSYYSASIYPSIYDFVQSSKEFNCQDMVVGAWLKNRNMKAIGLTHRSRYFQYNHPMNTIFDESLQAGTKHTEKFNRILQ